MPRPADIDSALRFPILKDIGVAAHSGTAYCVVGLIVEAVTCVESDLIFTLQDKEGEQAAVVVHDMPRRRGTDAPHFRVGNAVLLLWPR
jgi:hypothetical protein